ncbi:peptidyl-prolyl cis-trans isomerase A (cyclophilin A) [Sphingomonas sp. BE138]|uniref:peptidylprolyl isomerase n=1 Tax=Sphingomonas sp. BE138 TaxID=2817845 RepID=UPI002866A894|nr:peptidylprolyl isomerase [Sphingomonas sp. BE138]MDR6786844.1 peptidyl-prolyl cis-trans isomerase A (cyclophilin A) [Sphingomonas sp. BE138]
MIAALALLLAAPQVTAPAPPPPAPAATSVPAAPPSPAAPVPATLTRVVLTTAAGPIVIGVDTKAAPVTAANFLKYVDGKRLDGTNFYRAVKVGDGYGLVQFGTRNDPKRTLPAIKHEPTTQTGLSHTDGTISMAMAAPGTATGDFFVTVGNLTSMDAADGQPGFAAFGRVLEGMDVIRTILAAPTSPTLGEGAMKGQMLAPAIRIVTARRLP